MPFILILIAGVIAVAAFNNSQGTLASELETDVPGFLTWALAVAGVGALGWIPGMQTISRYLLALVMVVIVLKNYAQILAGFQAFQGQTGAAQTAASATPASAYIANPNSPQITTAEISGSGSVSGGAAATASGNINAAAQTPQVSSPYGSLDPSLFLAAYEIGLGGFGGL